MMSFYIDGEVKYSASIESIRAHSLALGDKYMQESSPANSPPTTTDNMIYQQMGPTSPMTQSHSMLSKLLQKDEREPLILKKKHSRNRKSKDYQSIQHDLESSNPINENDHHASTSSSTSDNTSSCSSTVSSKEFHSMASPNFWKACITDPISYIPAVILGLLLNLLDAISYGMITFPLNNPIFASFGPDGISMFFVR